MAQRRERHIRIRGKRLDEIDETKLALAVWMLAKKLVADGTEQSEEGPRVSESDPRADSKEAA